MKKLLLFALIAVFLSTGAYATDFSFTVNKPDYVFAGSSAEFILTINNLDSSSDWFSVSVLGTPETQNWVTVEKTNVLIDAGSSESVRIWITPPKGTQIGTYGFYFTVSSSDGTKNETQIYLSVRQPEIAASIKDYSLSCTLCEKELNITATVQNVGTTDIEDGKITFNVGSVEKSIDFTLEKGKSMTFTENFVLEGFVPGSYKASVKIYSEDKLLDSKEIGFAIPTVQKVDIEKKESGSIFGRSVELVAVNTGNVNTEAEIKSVVDNSWWVSYMGPEPDIKGEEWIWKRSLNPGEQITISYYEFYWVVPFGIILAIAVCVIVYLYMTAFSVKKKVFKRGGIFKKEEEYTVVIELKNKWKKIDRLVVKDFVPNGFSVTGKFESLKPLIKKTQFRTEIFWKIGTLRKNEERVLHYRIKPSTEYFGEVTLPGAEIVGIADDKRVVKITNKVRLQGKEKPREEEKIVVKTE